MKQYNNSDSKKTEASARSYKKYAIKNFMMGTSYSLHPLETLKIIAASSIFGERSYYRDSQDKPSVLKTISPFAGICFSDFGGQSTTEVFTNAIDQALEYDFRETLELALKLRTEYFMRLNPAIIAIRAALHPKRKMFNLKHGGYMRHILGSLILRPDDITNQFEYYMFLNQRKNHLPSLIKRVWSDRLSSFSAYSINKYASKSLIDLVRICHANSPIIDELMRTGKVAVPSSELTYQQLRSARKSWDEIFDTIRVPHMALLRNLAGIFSKEKVSERLALTILESLKQGVLHGKQFPYRYFSAYKEIQNAQGIQHQSQILECLEECMKLATENFPRLHGKTISLCDNSGSTRRTTTTEYGSVLISDIANLSGVITGMNSDEGHVGVFGDSLEIIPINPKKGVLSQHLHVCDVGTRQGMGTENGIWMFFNKAISQSLCYQNIFIYSDMQAGHGGLYGINPLEYEQYIYPQTGRNIDVLALVLAYRRKVNPYVNVFSVQVAGYDNSVLPENLYRTAILTGWTGKEVLYAKEMNALWDRMQL